MLQQLALLFMRALMSVRARVRCDCCQRARANQELRAEPGSRRLFPFRFRFRGGGSSGPDPELRPKITEKENIILSVPAAPLRAVVYSSRIERGARRDQENPNHVVNPSYPLFDSTGLFSCRQERRRTNKIRSLSAKSMMAAAGAALLRSVATKMARAPPRLPSALERHGRLSTGSRFSTSTGSTPQPANQVCCQLGL